MNNRLSYSQIRLYQECPKKFEYYYNSKLREKVRSGSLFFGSAIDRAIESVLKDPTIDEKAVFDKEFTEAEINKRKVQVCTSPLVVYSERDFDAELLTEEDWRFLAAKARELLPREEGTSEEILKRCAGYKKQKAYRHLKEEELIYYNIGNWLSMRRKGHLMLDAHRKKILPKIKKIVGTQVKIELKNDKEDSVIGYADLICRFEGHDEDIVIDYKTSGMEYEEDSVIMSQQLTLYTHALDLKKAGYIVFRKNILKNRVKTCSVCRNDGTGKRHKTCDVVVEEKRCGGEWLEAIKPEVDIQIIINEIPPRTTEIVMENLEVINKAIHNETFPRNLNSCKGGYGICAYFSLCYKNKMDGLEKLERS